MIGSWKQRVALTVLGVVAVAATLTAVMRNMRRNPEPYRYSDRRFEIPRPFLTREELHDILRPRPGEDVLEVGPGKGYYSLDVARTISPGGTLHILDVQSEMLDHTRDRAARSDITNITPTLADATELPYPDDSFDAAFLIAVLGEVPDKHGAVHELRRVLKPGGRLVVGEAITDPHRVASSELREMAGDAGLRFVRESGGMLGRFYLFTA